MQISPEPAAQACAWEPDDGIVWFGVQVSTVEYIIELLLFDCDASQHHDRHNSAFDANGNDQLDGLYSIEQKGICIQKTTYQITVECGIQVHVRII